MKFRHYLESITDVGVYPLASLFIFFVFFSLLAIWAFRANRRYIEHMKQMPLANGEHQQTS